MLEEGVRRGNMEQKEIRELLAGVQSGEVNIDDAVMKLKQAPYDDLGFAKIDNHRGLRQGISEVIYGAGKTKEQIAAIAQRMLENGQKTILITRMREDAAEYVGQQISLINDGRRKSLNCDEKPVPFADNVQKKSFIDGVQRESSINDAHQVPFTYDAQCHIGVVGEIPAPDGVGKIVVATGGTSDMAVAEEAAKCAECFGNEVVRLYDVGVAGLHRLLSHQEELMSARVVIAIAGMEGALVSVIGGLVDCPVIAVPTSVGYGANFGGLSALLSMLNSCASGVSVVNIDNGFGAGYLASMINHLR